MSSSTERRLTNDRAGRERSAPVRALRRLLAPLLVLGVLLGAGPLAAQAVRGVVVDGERPVEGMIVALYPESGGAAVGGALTDAQGRFSVRAPGPGRYTVRAERVGYRAASAGVELAAGQTAEVRLETEVRAFVLEPVAVSASPCEVRPGPDDQANRIWEHAAVALRATALAQEQELVEYTVRTYRSDMLGIRSRRRTDPPRRVTGQPFETLSPQALAERGYLRQDGDSLSFYGPDARVLLSDEFLDTHCLYVQLVEAPAGQVGIGFEPVLDRGLVDIRGTLWLDARTGELRSVEYRYTGLADASRNSPSGGRISFRRLRSGAWIVDRWHIRTARVLQSRWSHETRRNEIIADIREAGGEVTDITVVGQRGAAAVDPRIP